MENQETTTGLPSLPISTLFAMTFGFFGVNMAFSLQSSQMGRIFQTIGADPTKLGFFFILPPLMGMIVQPLVGKYSDLTWNRFGRRMPYLYSWCANRGPGSDSFAQCGIVWVRLRFTGSSLVWSDCGSVHGPFFKRLHATIQDDYW